MGAAASSAGLSDATRRALEELPAAAQQELEALAAAMNKAAPVPSAEYAPPAGLERAVRVGWLKTFAQEVQAAWTTADVVANIVKPRTESRKCRFVELPEMLDSDFVGAASAFASHTWGARFHDLVAQLAHVFVDSQFVWIDIFAVCQHPGDEQKADLAEFVPLVMHTRALILCATHLPSVLQIDRDAIVEQRSDLLPAEERRKCAFFRVWCLLELAAAAACGASVVMLVGESDASGFVPKDEMLDDLYHLVDVSHADATFESDKQLIFETLLPQTMQLDRAASIARVNQLARGAINGAEILLTDTVYIRPFRDTTCLRTAAHAVMQAAIGNTQPLSLLRSEHLSHAVTGAAAAGLVEPLKLLLDARASIESPDCVRGRTPLMLASNGGHEAVVRELLGRGANVNTIVSEGNTGDHALPLAAEGGHPSVIKLLVAGGADLAKYGANALTMAAVDGHARAISALIDAGVSPNAPSDGGYALSMCASSGHIGALKALLAAGSSAAAVQQAVAWTDAEKEPEAMRLLQQAVPSAEL
jgi:hypothetical protein